MDERVINISEQKQLADECYNEANKFLSEGKLNRAKEITARARSLYEEIGDKRKLASTLNIQSIIYDELGNDTMHLECLLDALEIAIDEEAYEISAKLYNNLGSKFMYLKSYDRALEYLKKALEHQSIAIEKHLDDEIGRASFTLILNLNLSTIYCLTGDIESAKAHFYRAKENFEKAEIKDLYLTFLAYEGLTLWRIGEKEEASELVEKIMETVKTTEYVTDYLEVMTDFLELMKEMHDFDRWEKALKIIEERLSDGVEARIKLEIQRRWLDFYKESGNIEKYAAGCIRFFELSNEKAVKDYAQRADAIELEAQMRRAKREKILTDSIVYLDTLTGIGNRNKMLEDSKGYIEKSIEEKSSIAIGLIDIDFFKECNDTYGHIEGDECLKKVASIIKYIVGDRGNVYRYGGDELLLLLPGISEDAILELGKDIKEGMEKERIPNIKSPITTYVTVSQGYTMAYAEPGDTIEQLVNLADRVLYSVKRCGRNNYKYTRCHDIVM